MSRMLSYYKSQLKSAAKSGPQFVTIESAGFFADENKKRILNGKKEGIVIRFKNDDIVHEELYWIFGKGFEQLNYLKHDFGNIPVIDLIGKKLWIVIRHNILIDDKQNEVKREAEIVHYSVDEQMPNYPTVFEQYDIAAV